MAHQAWRKDHYDPRRLRKNALPADCFGSELKADILQLSHHGFNGACLDLYKAIDPDICFWACDVTRFDTDGRCLGTINGYDFNKWLRDDSVKVRRHYHSSTTTTIELK